MLKAWRIVAALVVVAAALACGACSKKEDPAITTTKEFIKRAATGDPSLQEIIDYDFALNSFGTSSQDVIQKAGALRLGEIRKDITTTIITTFAQVKNTYKTGFKDFKVDEKGADYWIVSYLNPAKERKAMKVRNVDGVLKAYYFKK